MAANDRFEEAVEIFHQACDLPVDQRAGFLEEACGGDAELRGEVESLLQHDESDDSAVRAAEAGEAVQALAATATDATAEALPERIGKFRVIRTIGHGGMGTVYEAEQENPKRRVALKVIRTGLMSASLLKRFQHETHVLGQLQHSGIAHIYEAGHAEIRGSRLPFFAMEYIDGKPLDEYAKSHNLDTRQRLELIARVADAVQHAHQKGIVHRDLKPANILVVEEATEVTATRAGSGTSDEATEGDRIGSTKGEKRDPQGDSGTNCLAEVAVGDGSRHGHDDANAKPRSTTFLRRSVASSLRRSPVIGQPKILDFGIARVTDADIQTVTIQTDVGQLVGTLAYMSPEQVTGDSANIDTRSDIYTLGVILYELVTDRLPHDISGRAIPEAARIIREDDPSSVSSFDVSLRGDVETIIAKAMEKDPERRYASASALAADIRRHLSYEPIAAHPPSTMYQIGKFTKRNKGLVGGLVATFVALILGLLGTAVGLYEAKLTQARLEVVVDFQAEQLSDIRPSEVGRDMMEDLRGEFLRGLEKEDLPEDARKAELDSLEQVLERVNPTNLARKVVSGLYIDRAQKRLDDKFTDDPIVEADLRASVSLQYYRMGLYERSLEQRSQVLALRRQHLGPRHPDTLLSTSGVGMVLNKMGRLAEAEPFYREALEGRQDVLGPNHLRTLISLNNLANLLRNKRETDEAERIFRELIDRSTKLLGKDHDRTIRAMNNLGATLGDLGQTDEALVWLNRASEAWKRTKGPDDKQTILARNNLVAALLNANRLEEAGVIAREVVASFSRVQGDEHPDTIMARNNLGMVVFRGGHPAGAEPHLRAAYELSRQHLSPTSEIKMTSTSNLVDALLELSRPKEAETYCRELLAVRRALDPPMPHYVARSLEQLGRCLFHQGFFTDAEAAFRECLTIREGIAIDHWLTNLTRSLLGTSLAGQEKFEEAEPLVVEAHDALNKAKGKIPSWRRNEELSAARQRVVELYEAWGKPEEAAAWRAEAESGEGSEP